MIRIKSLCTALPRTSAEKPFWTNWNPRPPNLAIWILHKGHWKIPYAKRVKLHTRCQATGSCVSPLTAFPALWCVLIAGGKTQVFRCWQCLVLGPTNSRTTNFKRLPFIYISGTRGWLSGISPKAYIVRKRWVFICGPHFVASLLSDWFLVKCLGLCALVAPRIIII